TTRVTNGVRGESNAAGKEINARGLIAVIAEETGQQDLGVTIADDKSAPDASDRDVRKVDVYTGYVTNKAEALKMAEDSYAGTVAKVIYAWLMQEESNVK
ncbi:MAG: hypothetical protein J5842_03265, partial [Lachnospiraceae bacterium]|nr:hypothetical protein [Lachnospiraceae bacterium]